MKNSAFYLTAVSAVALNLLANTAAPAIEAAHSPVEDATFEAIARYPEEIREAILIASTQPELIVRVAALQDRSSQMFEDANSHTKCDRG